MKKDSIFKLLIAPFIVALVVGFIVLFFDKNWDNFFYDSDKENIVKVDKHESEDTLKKTKLSIVFKTNKKDNTFTEGEPIRFYFKANKSCFISVIQPQTDSISELSFENFFITKKNVGKEVVYPQVYSCIAPFGKEQFILIASETKLPKMFIKQFEQKKIDPTEDNLIVDTIFIHTKSR